MQVGLIHLASEQIYHMVLYCKCTSHMSFGITTQLSHHPTWHAVLYNTPYTQTRTEPLAPPTRHHGNICAPLLCTSARRRGREGKQMECVGDTSEMREGMGWARDMRPWGQQGGRHHDSHSESFDSFCIPVLLIRVSHDPLLWTLKVAKCCPWEVLVTSV